MSRDFFFFLFFVVAGRWLLGREERWLWTLNNKWKLGGRGKGSRWLLGWGSRFVSEGTRGLFFSIVQAWSEGMGHWGSRFLGVKGSCGMSLGVRACGWWSWDNRGRINR